MCQHKNLLWVTPRADGKEQPSHLLCGECGWTDLQEEIIVDSSNWKEGDSYKFNRISYDCYF